ncbi:hypothetical protein OEV98_08100 [Caldibacillus lycopersici]|uniref:Uncharacterized protein n=1 Tax=Perspicuibacillus lycopersici TaxID=1325689 RepID=A0AAE3ITX1_9BACI|nr:hypothetical protein [Perspicuibacillus lycopersici]MCU9613518.1 hypothetical protein [Perspicuibacillus lycopersici]
MFIGHKEPTVEEINRNITLLLDYPWFREIFENKEFREIIENNQDLRMIIGRENIKNIKYYPRKQLKLRSIIMNELFNGIKG